MQSEQFNLTLMNNNYTFQLTEFGLDGAAGQRATPNAVVEKNTGREFAVNLLTEDETAPGKSKKLLSAIWRKSVQVHLP